MADEVQNRIEKILSSERVVVFMKGDRLSPACGFSGEVVQILDQLLDDYATVNVIAEAELRDGIKRYSSWPTIPQLFIDGELVGGADIARELFASGELEQKLGASRRELAAPELSLSESARPALSAALESEADRIRLTCSARFDHELSVGPAQAGDLSFEVSGVRFAVDAASARRLKGVSIDLIETPAGPAFKIDNPQEPPRVKPMTVRELQEKLAGGAELTLIDVRTPAEREICRIEGSRLLEQSLIEEIGELDRDSLLVFQCHHGVRSQHAAEHFVAQGFRNVYNLLGGIDAWSVEVDSDVPRY